MIWVIRDEVRLAKYNKVLLKGETQKAFYSFHEMKSILCFYCQLRLHMI
jgi:hypothetical protein